MTRNRQWQIAGIVVLVVALGWVAIRHSRTEGDNGKSGADGTAPVAAVVKVDRQNVSSDLDIASEFLPFQEIDVYAKESGYIKKLYIDWGTHVGCAPPPPGLPAAVPAIPESPARPSTGPAWFTELAIRRTM